MAVGNVTDRSTYAAVAFTERGGVVSIVSRYPQTEQHVTASAISPNGKRIAGALSSGQPAAFFSDGEKSFRLEPNRENRSEAFDVGENGFVVGERSGPKIGYYGFVFRPYLGGFFDLNTISDKLPGVRIVQAMRIGGAYADYIAAHGRAGEKRVVLLLRRRVANEPS